MNEDLTAYFKLIDAAAEMRRRGDFRGAVQLYSELLRTHSVSEIYNERGVLYSQLGDYDDAIRDLTHAIDLRNDDADCYVNRGNAYFRIGHFEAAMDDYNRAIELAPDFREAYNGRGNVHVRLGLSAEATMDFLRSIELDNTYASPYHNLAALFLKIGQHRKAAMQYALRANKLDPDDAAHLCLLGDIFAADGDFARAVQMYQDATIADATFVLADLRMAWLLSTSPDKSMRDGSQAVEYATRACCKTDWKDYDGLSTLAAAWAECGHYNEAAHWQAGAVAVAPAWNVAAARAYLSKLIALCETTEEKNSGR